MWHGMSRHRRFRRPRRQTWPLSHWHRSNCRLRSCRLCQRMCLHILRIAVICPAVRQSGLYLRSSVSVAMEKWRRSVRLLINARRTCSATARVAPCNWELPLALPDVSDATWPHPIALRTKAARRHRVGSLAPPNSALERTSPRYSASLETRASSGPKPLSSER